MAHHPNRLVGHVGPTVQPLETSREPQLPPLLHLCDPSCDRWKQVGPQLPPLLHVK
jgi:hypothetical protein